MGVDARAASTIDLLSVRLRSGVIPTGGWGYYPGKRPRVEPTCWALTALHGTSDDGDEWNRLVSPHLAFLSQHQTAAGALSDTGGATTNLAFDGLAATMLPHVAGVSAAGIVSSLLRPIVSTKGIKAPQADDRQDNSLQAWPWYPDTFSWVEPTSWCLLALKKTAGASADVVSLQSGLKNDEVRARIDEAERMLENRCCDAGGWNYGNASVVGQDLRPHIPTTAVALIALQDRRDRAFVKRSVDLLDRLRLKEESSIALGMTIVALHLHGRKVDDVRDRLTEIASRSASRGDVHAMAVALYALTIDRHDAKALRVG
jgi:hypothetical protein